MTRHAKFNASSMLAAIALCAMAAPAFAQALPSDLRLTFTQPTGVVSPVDIVPIYVTLTNTGTQAFVVDDSLPNLGLNPSLLPTTGYYLTGPVGHQTAVASTYASYTSAKLFAPTPACAVPYSDGCWPAYLYLGAPTVPSVSLASGASTSFLFGQLIPVRGPAAEGTYSIDGVGLSLLVDGRDAQGHELRGALNPLQLATTCANLSNAACAAAGLNFTRTVSAVPEPAPAALLALGLAALALRRRRQA